MKIYKYDSVVIGSGAAGYSAAVRIKEAGKRSVALITEDVMCGTSRNAGSDKQTYYKLSLAGDAPDSVRKMTAELYGFGSVDGDNALCEAALSVRCFLNLYEAGVEFPMNAYGEFVGYKTDHDPCARASSAGPLTSKFMTEALERKAERLELAVLDDSLAIEILKDAEGVLGVLCINTKSGELFAVHTPYVVLATGGPGGIYADSVYPLGHTGSTSLALHAGAALQNLTEWQYGLASVAPRWNVSGTYMQVLPRFVSVDDKGVEREFLEEFFKDPYECLSMVFLKGYQWPFDSRKILEGSSVIDLLVYRETVMRGRRVYLDFMKNPFGLKEIDYSKLSKEAFTYLERGGACFGTPIERLYKMNTPAVDFYKGRGRYIEKEYLEIALCAQHNNGGISVDAWWQTKVNGLFAVGECAGTHGITRPGGSALNAGQVGALRAATYINEIPRAADEARFTKMLKEAEARNTALCAKAVGTLDNTEQYVTEVTHCMSACGGAIRRSEKLDEAIGRVSALRTAFYGRATVDSSAKLYKIYKLRDILDTSLAVLSAMKDYAETAKLTRGSALIYSAAGTLRDGLEECFRFIPADRPWADQVQELSLHMENGELGNMQMQSECVDEDSAVGRGDGFAMKNSGGTCNQALSYNILWRPTRPIPECDNFFENVWRGYLKNKNICDMRSV